MSLRAIIFGLLLGLFVAGTTYWNDAVIRQTYLIGNHFPIGVFGIVLLMLVAGNPLLGFLRDRLGLGLLGGPFKSVEICLIAAIALAACGWPGSNLYRVSTTIPSQPQHLIKNEASWKAANVMAYVPGGSATLALGHVQDWSAVVDGLRAGEQEDAEALDRAIWKAIPPRYVRTVREVAGATPTPGQQADLLTVLNDYLIAPLDDTGGAFLYELADPASLPESVKEAVSKREALLARVAGLSPEDAVFLAGELTGEARAMAELANRMLLVERWGGALLPPPPGKGLLVTGGRADPFVIDTLLTGRPVDRQLGLTQLPWEAWWPTIRLWGGVVLLLGFASLCMALIVHPQWSRRELLTYPIVKFMEEASERQPGAWLPAVASSKLFWIGVSVPVVLHTVNGLNVWFTQLPDIPLDFDFGALRKLFPNISQVAGNNAYFTPKLFLSVIAFSFFLSSKVSFSLGISQLLLLMLGGFLIATGETLDTDYIAAKKANLLRFGAYMGITLIILYTGRTYYLNVLASAAGRRRALDTPGYAPWAMRGLVLCFVLAVVLLGSGGLGWVMAVVLVTFVLVIFLVQSRICAETGLFFNQATWLPVGIITALFGAEAIGPTTYIVLALASTMLVGDPRETLMPFLVNALKLGDRPAERSTPGRVAPWLGVMIVASFVVAGAVTMYTQYNTGINANDAWSRAVLPSMPFRELSNMTRELASSGTLAESTAAAGTSVLTMMRPEKGALFWLLLGGVLVVATAAARLRIPWWPLHPVLFLVWGTYPIIMFAASFLVGWVVKAAVIRTAGAKGYHDVKPIMVGVIGGELFMALVWMVVGAVYFLYTGSPPKSYSIFPR